MLVKIEARIPIFPRTDFHFPSMFVPPGTFLGSGTLLNSSSRLTSRVSVAVLSAWFVSAGVARRRCPVLSRSPHLPHINFRFASTTTTKTRLRLKTDASATHARRSDCIRWWKEAEVETWRSRSRFSATSAASRTRSSATCVDIDACARRAGGGCCAMCVARRYLQLRRSPATDATTTTTTRTTYSHARPPPFPLPPAMDYFRFALGCSDRRLSIPDRGLSARRLLRFHFRSDFHIRLFQGCFRHAE